LIYPWAVQLRDSDSDGKAIPTYQSESAKASRSNRKRCIDLRTASLLKKVYWTSTGGEPPGYRGKAAPNEDRAVWCTLWKSRSVH